MDLSIKSVSIAALLREHPIEIFTRRGMLLLTVSLLLCYAYLAGVSVFHAVVQRATEAQIERSKTTLADLEREYYSLTKSIDMANAGTIGLGVVGSKNFVERAVLDMMENAVHRRSIQIVNGLKPGNITRALNGEQGVRSNACS